MQIFDDRPCKLGEGPLWHPTRQQFFWFDVLNNTLMSRDGDTPVQWRFSEIVSAAGWTGDDSLLIASETRLFDFNLNTGAETTLCALEADTPDTRSNDGRADMQGGFWIGTMGKTAAKGAGAIYRYYKDDLRRLFPGISIPNAICFAPDGTRAYYTDTLAGQIMAQPLDAEGWPKGNSHVLVDLRAEGFNPDGAVTDAAGNIWNAQWGAARVAGYTSDGSFIRAYDVPARHSSCPALGGADFSTLFCTSAREMLDAGTIANHPENGLTFAAETTIKGRAEPQVLL